MNKSNKSRRRIFAVMAMVLPILMLVIIEMVMRLCGYGYNPELFVEDNTHNYYYMNPEASRPYFTVRENATQGVRDYFRKDKSDSTLRIFVLGASTNVGFPYMHNGSFPRMLQYRLQMENPGRHVEIINLSLTAINSVTLRDFAKELKAFSPDAVLIYAGHNEYYGAMGVASTSGVSNQWMNRIIVGLSKFKIGQWVVNVAAKLKGSDERLTDERLNLMERMVGVPTISADSPEYERGVQRYRENMCGVLSSLSEAGIPVYLATVSSNIRSLKPFNPTGSGWDEANHLLMSGDSIAALTAFIAAKDNDGLRFRAPSDINSIIRQLGEEFPDVHIVDVDSAFMANSSYGIPGEELFLEHVHPNLTGQILIAEQFYNALADGMLIHKTDEAFGGYPLTEMDNHYGKIQNWLLRENWPFNEPVPDEPPGYNRSFEESVAGALAVKQITWSEAMRILLEHYVETGDTLLALKVAEGLWLDSPYNGEAAYIAAIYASLAGDTAKTKFYVHRAKEGGAPDELVDSLIDIALKNESNKITE